MKNILLILVTLDVLKFDKSKYSNSSHSSNIPFILVTLIVLNFSIPFISFNLKQSINIAFISATLEVLKLDKSKNSNSLHSSNILFILVTLIVLKLLIPFISFSL